MNLWAPRAQSDPFVNPRKAARGVGTGDQSQVFSLFHSKMAQPRRKSSRHNGCSIPIVFSGTLVHSTRENMMDICQKRIIGIDNDGKVTDSFCFVYVYSVYVTGEI